MKDKTNAIKAADALAAIPVTAMYADGTETDTTAAKAMGLDPDAMAKKAAEDAEWEQGMAELGQRLKRLQRQIKLDMIIDHTAKCVAKALKEFEERKIAVRVEKSLQRAAEYRAEAERLERDIEVKKAAIAESEWEIAKMQAAHVAFTDQVTAFTQEARIRIDAMMDRLETGNNAVRSARAYEDTREAARIDRERSEWAFKASTVNDPTLRTVYLNRSQGVPDDE